MIDWIETKKRFGRSDLRGRRPEVSVRCDICNKLGSKIINNKSLVDGNNYEWECKSCSVKKQWENGCFSKHSENMQNRWKNNEYRNIFQSKEFKNKKKKQSNKIWSNEDMKQTARERSLALWKTEEFREKSINVANPSKLSNSSKELWKSDDYRQKVVSSIKRSLNSKEYKQKSMLTRDQFIKKAIDLHGDKYDYSLVKYCGYKEKIDILCKDHGVFSQRVINHLQGCGCPKCPKQTSLQQKELFDFVSTIVTNIKENDRELISPYEIDLLLPESKIAIEYNGIYWHSFNKKESSSEIMKHSYKHDMCLDNGYKLIQINENEWCEKRSIIESKLRNEMGMSNKIYARKCKIIKLDSQQHKKFMDQNHVQGGKGCNIAYGLKYNDDLVAVMSFNKHKKYNWEITRFANKLDTVVVGGASKLFKRFIKENNPDQILTYADRRYSNGNLYNKLGFKLNGITKPNYCYVKSSKVYSRQQFMKHKLKDKLETFDPKLTEVENMFNNGYRRLWDAGNYRFLWTGSK